VTGVSGVARCRDLKLTDKQLEHLKTNSLPIWMKDPVMERGAWMNKCISELWPFIECAPRPLACLTPRAWPSPAPRTSPSPSRENACEGVAPAG